MKTGIRRVLCLAAVLMLLVAAGQFAPVDAASDSITVTSYTTGEKLYSGSDLQEAFDAAERGSIVSIGRNYTMTQDAVLKVEVMLDGQNFLRFGTYRILLAGDGAIFVTKKFSRSTYVKPLHDYSEVERAEENGGYIYYLKTTAPSLEGYEPAVTPGDGLYGAFVDTENKMIYLDADPSGITTEALSAATSMQADYSEAVQFYYDGHAAGLAANGMTMIASAANYDYGGTAEKSYQVVILGDVNGNGRIDAADASLITFFVDGSQELTGLALLAADANQDGEVTADDAALLCSKYVRPDQYTSPLG